MTDHTYAFPLSTHQRPILAHERAGDLGSAYHMVAGYAVVGVPREAVLAGAVRLVVARHEALRTVFRTVDGDPCQIVLPVLDVPVDIVEPTPDRVGEVLADHTEAAFDLATGPLLRVLLARTGPRQAILLLVMHHLVGDGWSMDVLARDLVRTYGDLVRGVRADRNPPTQYPDFTLWEAETVPLPEIERQLGHWRERIAGAAMDLALCPDRPRGAVWDNRVEITGFRVGPDVARPLAAVAAQRGATMYLAVLAAFQVALGALCYRRRFVLGTASNRRTRADLDDLVGLVANFMVPVPVDLTGEPTLIDVLDRVREQAVAAMANQDVPIDTLLASLDPDRDGRVPPTLQVGFQLAAADSVPPLDAVGLRFTPVPTATRHGYAELALSVVHGDGLDCSLQWTTAHHDAPAIDDLIAEFTARLAQMANRPHDPVWHTE